MKTIIQIWLKEDARIITNRHFEIFEFDGTFDEACHDIDEGLLLRGYAIEAKSTGDQNVRKVYRKHQTSFAPESITRMQPYQRRIIDG